MRFAVCQLNAERLQSLGQFGKSPISLGDSRCLLFESIGGGIQLCVKPFLLSGKRIKLCGRRSRRLSFAQSLGLLCELDAGGFQLIGKRLTRLVASGEVC